MIRQSGLYDYFEFLISNEDVKRAKPDPEIYHKALERLGCKPQEVVIVEDAPHGIESGRRSGGHVCEVSGFPEVDYFRIKGFIDRVERAEVTA